jgi:hypothetical protein
MSLGIISLPGAGKSRTEGGASVGPSRWQPDGRIIRYQMCPFIDIQKLYKKFHKDSNFLTF